MDTIQLGASELDGSRLAYGCMRIAGDGSPADRKRGKAAVLAAIENGYTLFDHADIYGDGRCEEVFGEVLHERPDLRDGILIQGKCGVRFDDVNRYDLSGKHIMESVERSLRRLATERLDVFLLHRPDYLMDIHEVAAAFDSLYSSGKVAEFGVSNFLPATLAALQSATPRRLQVNQVEINVHNVNALNNGVLDQCQAQKITPQAWCPVAGIAYEAWGNTFSAERAADVKAEAQRQAEYYETEDWLIALAWILRHPATISPIVGSTTPQRIAAAVDALSIDYSREDWYRLLEARNGQPVP
ncbi:MAG: aldo/keto reductase [Chromatiales bacterium]|nr:MAG: aldo/keto reductase [Chromatiales bacterium]